LTQRASFPAVVQRVDAFTLNKEALMAICDTCGIRTDEPLRITYHGQTCDFCCFECAITPLAPRCAHCEGKVIGHGSYGEGGRIFCCSHCKELAEQGAVAPV